MRKSGERKVVRMVIFPAVSLGDRLLSHCVRPSPSHSVSSLFLCDVGGA